MRKKILYILMFTIIFLITYSAIDLIFAVNQVSNIIGKKPLNNELYSWYQYNPLFHVEIRTNDTNNNIRYIEISGFQPIGGEIFTCLDMDLDGIMDFSEVLILPWVNVISQSKLFNTKIIIYYYNSEEKYLIKKNKKLVYKPKKLNLIILGENSQIEFDKKREGKWNLTK